MDWTWDATLFAGAAPYYQQGRAPYAPGLADAMAASLQLDGRGRLMDVGCGPGTVILQVAHLFEEVVGLDADGGMIGEARRIAAERGVVNARWEVRRAEDLPAELGRFHAVLFAASFHWMERERVATAVRGMLEPGGALVHVDNHHQDGLDPRQPGEFPPPPILEIAELTRVYLGPDRRAGQSIRNTSPDNEAAIFSGAGFVGPESVLIPDGRLLVRTTDEVVAHAFSNSGTAPHLFGDQLAQFEAELRQLLMTASPSGHFLIEPPDNELKIWRVSPRGASSL